MLKTIGQRLHSVRLELKLSQKQMGDILGVTQGAYSFKESGRSALTNDEAHKIEEEFGYRAEWIQFGSGEKKLPASSSVLSEPDVQYHTANKYSDDAIKNRFINQATAYQSSHAITQAELCQVLHINRDHFSAIKNGHKELTLPMLTKSARYGKFNMNYTMCAIGDLFIDPSKEKNSEAECEKFKEELKLKEELVRTQRMLIEQLTKKN